MHTKCEGRCNLISRLVLQSCLTPLVAALQQTIEEHSLEAEVIDFWMNLGLLEGEIFTAHSPNGTLFGKEVTMWNRESTEPSPLLRSRLQTDRLAPALQSAPARTSSRGALRPARGRSRRRGATD